MRRSLSPARPTRRSTASALGASEHGVDAWFTQGRLPAGQRLPGAGRDGRRPSRGCAALGEGDQLVSWVAAEVQARCASPAFREGVLMPSAATIQPARLARGLRRVLLERGVAIHEGTAALASAGSDRVELATDDGAALRRPGRAGPERLGGRLAGLPPALVAWGSYMALTEPTPDRLATLGWTGGERSTDSRFTVHYFRTTPDGRVAFGARRRRGGLRRTHRGRVRRATGTRSRAWSADFRHLLPGLDDVGSRRRGAARSTSSDRLPLIGSTDGGRVHHAHGYSGNGVGPSHLAGRILAARVAGADDPSAAWPSSADAAASSAGAVPLRRRAHRARGAHPARRARAGRRPGPLVRLLAAAAAAGLSARPLRRRGSARSPEL